MEGEIVTVNEVLYVQEFQISLTHVKSYFVEIHLFSLMFYIHVFIIYNDFHFKQSFLFQKSSLIHCFQIILFVFLQQIMKRLIKRYVLKAQVDKENDEVNEGKD